jgi:hypothetical protein
MKKFGAIGTTQGKAAPAAGLKRKIGEFRAIISPVS